MSVARRAGHPSAAAEAGGEGHLARSEDELLDAARVCGRPGLRADTEPRLEEVTECCVEPSERGRQPNAGISGVTTGSEEDHELVDVRAVAEPVGREMLPEKGLTREFVTCCSLRDDIGFPDVPAG